MIGLSVRLSVQRHVLIARKLHILWLYDSHKTLIGSLTPEVEPTAGQRGPIRQKYVVVMETELCVSAAVTPRR